MFLVQLWLNLTLFLMKILFNLCSLWKCLSNKFSNTRPMFVVWRIVPNDVTFAVS